MARLPMLIATVAAMAGMTGGCSTAGTGPTQNGRDIPVADRSPPAGKCQAASVADDTLIGKSEQEATALLDGCLWRISERDGKGLPGTMDYRQERRSLGLQNGKVIWVRRG